MKAILDLKPQGGNTVVDKEDFEQSDHFLLPLPTIPDERGKLSVVESGRFLPFEIQRVYYLFDVPAGSERGGHAHLDLQQLLIAISGSFTVDVESAAGKVSYTLNRPNEALYIGSLVWREMRNFSSNAVCLVLASHLYNESDYIRSYDLFKQKLSGENDASSIC